jgi:hypothetical protein
VVYYTYQIDRRNKSMKKYEVKESTIEVNYKNRKNIKAGVSLESENQEPTIIASFDTLKEAQKKLKELKTDIKENHYNGTFYNVTEYYIEENEYDEDGDWLTGGDIYDFSEMNINVVEGETRKDLGTFHDFESALKFAETCDCEYGTDLVF